MFSSTAYKGLCPFLYPPAARQYTFNAQRCLRGQSVRSWSTSVRHLKSSERTASTSAPVAAQTETAPSPAAGAGSFEPSPPSPFPSAAPPPDSVSLPSLTKPNPDDRVTPEYEGEQHRKLREAAMPLRFLDRPLGLPSPPTTAKKGWPEMRKELFERGRIVEERQHLVKQIMTGYYNDVHQLRYHGGKRWTAPEVLVKADRALYFPDIVGAALNGPKSTHTTDLCKGKISIVCFIGSQMAEKHIADFTKLALESFGNDPAFRFVQINIQENPLKAFLVSMFSSRLKSQIPEKYHPYYLLSSHNMEYFREPLGCTNKMLGYVYLLDEDLKVRWAGGGHPNPEEQVSLHRCTGVLLKRFREKKVAPRKPATTQPAKGGKR